MHMNKVVGAGLVSMSLVVGLAGFAGATSGTIGTTGPDSTNKITSHNWQKTTVKNHNDVTARNTNSQAASSGKAGVYHNTTAGDAKTGNAANANALNASATVTNTTPATHAVAPAASAGSASISMTGPDSYNKIKYSSSSEVKIENRNDLHVTNTSTQTAVSGDATVAGNTKGGSATTGSASNSNAATITFKVSN